MSSTEDIVKEIDQMLDRADQALATCGAPDDLKRTIAGALEVHRTALSKAKDALDFCSAGYRQMCCGHVERVLREIDALIEQMRSFTTASP